MRFPLRNGASAIAIVALVLLWSLSDSFDPQDNDNFCEEILKTGKSAEALAWFHEADGTDKWRTISEYDNTRSGSIIQEIYDLGATKVMAAEIDSEPDIGETTDILIVTLPDDPTKRADLLRFESRLARLTGLGGTPDRGQKYLFLWWD